MHAEGVQSQIWTALPVKILKHDVEKGTVHAQPTIKLQNQQKDGKLQWKEIPKMEDMPIFYPSGGGATFTFPIKEGDEGLAIFSSRSIDKWFNEGGIQEQTESWMHSLSDGFVLVGFRSTPRKLKNVSTTTAQIRTEDGSTFIEFDPAGSGKVRIKSSSNPVRIEGDLVVTGEITAKVDGNHIQLSTHVHDGVATGIADTTAPKANT